MLKNILQKFSHTVKELSQPIRFNTYCEEFIAILPSRKGIKKAIKRGELRLNGEHAEGGRWLKPGDVITLIDLESTPPKTYWLKLTVLFEDEDLAVIIKPAGINVSGNQFKTIQNALLHNINPSVKEDKLPWPLPVHRLDNQTSGLMIIAKTKTARVALGQAFERKMIEKTYRAVVIGQAPENGDIHLPIENKPASSTFKKLAAVPSLKNGTLSLIELYPQTGRTHQLRIHCAALNLPILGDKLYGPENLILKHKGLFLCAVKLKFNHPVSNKPVEFSMPTPPKFLKRLENEKKRFLNYNKT